LYLERNECNNKLRGWGEILTNATLAPITNIILNTKSIALTTLWTLGSALEHGIYGCEPWFQEYRILSNMKIVDSQSTNEIQKSNK